jgi:hypothetical protein
MGKVDVISIHGVEFIFWSNDHDPPHFHAKKAGEWEYKVHFMEAKEQMLEMLWENKSMKGNLRRDLVELVASNRLALFAEWEAKVSQ